METAGNDVVEDGGFFFDLDCRASDDDGQEGAARLRPAAVAVAKTGCDRSLRDLVTDGPGRAVPVRSAAVLACVNVPKCGGFRTRVRCTVTRLCDSPIRNWGFGVGEGRPRQRPAVGPCGACRECRTEARRIVDRQPHPGSGDEYPLLPAGRARAGRLGRGREGLLCARFGRLTGLAGALEADISTDLINDEMGGFAMVRFRARPPTYSGFGSKFLGILRG